MSFHERAWQASAQIRARIDQLALLRELADGTLEPARFVEYLVQDDFYLRGYARALAMLAARAPSAEAAAFWATSAGEAVAAEVELHAGLLADERLSSQPRPQHPSPTTRGYIGTLLSAAAFEPYPVAAAAVLPCYWIYADVGERLAKKAGDVHDHPYASWVAAYADPAFQQATTRAIELVDEAASVAPARVQDAMLEAFLDAARYEELFWQRSYELERWTR